MNLNVITGIHIGGPYNWGKNLVSILCKKGVEANHVHKLNQILMAHLYQNADIVHTTHAPLAAYKLWNKPTVITIHGDFITEKRKGREKGIGRADIVTTPSRFLKERLDLKESVVIPNAVFPEQFKMVRHADKDVINIVTITKFFFKDKAKGVLDILKILDSLPEEVLNHINYSIVGGGPYLKTVVEEAKRYKVNVQFVGMLPRPTDILEGSDIFIYYSHLDNFPIVILEAMACGLPVVTNDVGAVNEIIRNEEDGFIAPNHSSYVEYLINLIKAPGLRSRVGEKARKSVEEKFNWEAIVGKYIDIYSKITPS